LGDGNGVCGGFFGVIFLVWWSGVFAGGFAKSGVQGVVFCWRIYGECMVNRGVLTA
jgi:hypothetical protein